jgi:YedE family putative selenium metabolism protein
MMPAIMLGLLLLLLFRPQFTKDGPIFFSTEGPGSQRANYLVALGIAVVIGFIAQRTRFCTMGAIRDVILMRDFHLGSGVVALLAGAFIMNLVYGQKPPLLSCPARKRRHHRQHGVHTPTRGMSAAGRRALSV